MFGKGQIFSVRTENFSFFSVFLSSFSAFLGCVHTGCTDEPWIPDRKSTRLNSSHLVISYAVFCLKKKKFHVPAPSRYYPWYSDLLHYRQFSYLTRYTSIFPRVSVASRPSRCSPRST